MKRTKLYTYWNICVIENNVIIAYGNIKLQNQKLNITVMSYQFMKFTKTLVKPIDFHLLINKLWHFYKLISFVEKIKDYIIINILYFIQMFGNYLNLWVCFYLALIPTYHLLILSHCSSIIQLDLKKLWM